MPAAERVSTPKADRPMLKRRFFASFVAVSTSALLLAPGVAMAQGLGAGALHVTIVDQRDSGMRDVTVTLESRRHAIHTYSSDLRGRVDIPVLAPGNYSVLAEQLGYQPVRMLDVLVSPGARATITITLERRPPPITTVAEIESNASPESNTNASISGRDLVRFARHDDIGDALRGVPMASAPFDDRETWLENTDGLAAAHSTLLVDGVREPLLRHPAWQNEAAGSPAFSTAALDQVSFVPFATDAGIPGDAGATILATTQTTGGPFRFDPWIDVANAKLGGRGADNPGDSTALSVRGGVTLGGPIKGDTASWLITANYQQVELPTALPREAGVAGADSGDVLAAFSTAANLMQQDLSRWSTPTVRRWKGGDGEGRLDWRFGDHTLLGFRFGAASWTETNPLVGSDLVNGAGTRLSAHDVSGAASLITGQGIWTSETRLGVHSSVRDWDGAGVPYTAIVGDAIAAGTAPTLPGNFRDGGGSVDEAVTMRVGSHALSATAGLDYRSINDDWVPGSDGVYQFGDIAGFGALTGTFYQASRASTSPDLGVTQLSLSIGDSWQATPALELFGGVRFQHESLPADAIALNTNWGLVSDIRNNLVPTDSKGAGFGPRGGLRWDLTGDGKTILGADVGIVPGEFDLLRLAEAAEFDGDVTVRRAAGAVTWPTPGDITPVPSLTLFNFGVHKPRSYKSDLSLTQRVGRASTLTLAGGYDHTDYLLRRSDLNLVATPISTGSDGSRPIYGDLEQFGALVTPSVGSNRRFDDFDMVYGLTSDGYSDVYHVDLTFEHRVARGLDVHLAYTYSKTDDNLIGEASANPADQLSPFATDPTRARWDDARSDFDIPHRVAATLVYTLSGATPVEFSARYRYRSGLPFTPGFRNGVDANGDGSGNNDPAFIGTDIPGMSALTGANGCLASQTDALAGRNSCRDPGISALDLSMGIPIRAGGGHSLRVTFDALNLIATNAGIFDHAALLIDPKGPITYNGAGQVVLPLLANPSFGKLLSRRDGARELRVGLRVEE